MGHSKLSRLIRPFHIPRGRVEYLLAIERDTIRGVQIRAGAVNVYLYPVD